LHGSVDDEAADLNSTTKKKIQVTRIMLFNITVLQFKLSKEKTKSMT
jgi:hypothetical protein